MCCRKVPHERRPQSPSFLSAQEVPGPTGHRQKQGSSTLNPRGGERHAGQHRRAGGISAEPRPTRRARVQARAARVQRGASLSPGGRSPAEGRAGPGARRGRAGDGALVTPSPRQRAPCRGADLPPGGGGEVADGRMQDSGARVTRGTQKRDHEERRTRGSSRQSRAGPQGGPQGGPQDNSRLRVGPQESTVCGKIHGSGRSPQNLSFTVC